MFYYYEVCISMCFLHCQMGPRYDYYAIFFHCLIISYTFTSSAFLLILRTFVHILWDKPGDVDKITLVIRHYSESSHALAEGRTSNMLPHTVPHPNWTAPLHMQAQWLMVRWSLAEPQNLLPQLTASLSDGCSDGSAREWSTLHANLPLSVTRCLQYLKHAFVLTLKIK